MESPTGQTIAVFAAERVAAISGAELRERYGAGKLKRAVARGTITRVLPDVYSAPAHASSFVVRASAAAMWADAPVAGLASLFLWGIIEAPPEVIDVLVSPDRKLRYQPGVRVRRLRCEVPCSIRHGVPTLSPAAAIVLGYGLVAPGTRAEIVYGAVRRGLVGPQQLDAMARSVTRVKARASLERSIAAAVKGAQSFLEEHALYRVFNTDEFSRFLRQHEVVIEGNQFFLDMFDAVTKTAVELDGRNGHTDEGRQRNITRDCWVATIGIVTLRFSFADVFARPEWCRQMVRETLRARSLRARRP